MPLRDHFHPPVANECGWPSIHMTWAVDVIEQLNGQLLPKGYRAEGEVCLGGSLEVDVGTLDSLNGHSFDTNGNGAGTATLPWAPPAPTITFPLQSYDLFEVRILDTRSGRPLVAAIEFVSPGNKDRDEARAAFVSKISDLIHSGIGVVVIDIVTSRSANLHNELAASLNLAASTTMRPEEPPYIVSYAPFKHLGSGGVNCWPHRLAIGQPIPEIPLALSGGPIVRLDLETAYESACRKNRLA